MPALNKIPAGRKPVSVALPDKVAEKLERCAERAGTSKNAIINALLAVSTEDEIIELYQRALAAGLIAGANKASPERKALLARLSSMPTAELERLASAMHADSDSHD